MQELVGKFFILFILISMCSQKESFSGIFAHLFSMFFIQGRLVNSYLLLHLVLSLEAQIPKAGLLRMTPWERLLGWRPTLDKEISGELAIVASYVGR